MTVHASKELLEAMLGESPNEHYHSGRRLFDHEIRHRVAIVCGAIGVSMSGHTVAMAFDGGPRSIRDTEFHTTCPDCLRAIRASFPEEALVRLDYLETRLPPPRCPSCDFGPFIPMRKADGFNHRAVAGSTHVCTACGKGWRP